MRSFLRTGPNRTPIAPAGKGRRRGLGPDDFLGGSGRMRTWRVPVAIIALLTAAFAFAAAPARAQPPLLEHRGETVQLMVDGRPFLILGGELANSSASSRAYMAPVW